MKLLKKLPRSSREQAAWKMAAILEEVILKNDITTWTRFLNFPKRGFKVPNRGRKRWSLAKHVNNQLVEENDPSSPTYVNVSTHQFGKKHCSDPLQLLASSVSTKLEEGNFRGVVCHLQSLMKLI